MIVKFFSKNYLIIILAVIIGILTVAPSIYFRYFDDGYQGIDLFGSDAEYGYLAQIQEIYDGHFSFGNVYLTEGKDQPYVQQPMLPMFIASLGKTIGLSVLDINMITKFFFPALLGVLVYIFFSSIFKRKDLALLMTAFIMLAQATSIFLDPRAWLPFISKGIFVGMDSQFLHYARPINPQLSSFFFFGYLLCLWKFLFELRREKFKRVFGIAGAIVLGLSFYTYFFTFSFLFAINGVLIILFLFKKDWQRLKEIIYLSLVAVAMGIPYIVNTINVFSSPFYGALSHRLGSVDSYKFIFSKVWWGVFIGFIFLYRKFDNLKIFILALLSAAFLVTNQQLITGRTAPVVSHFHWYYVAPLGGVILIYLFFLYFEKIASIFWSRTVMTVLILVFLCAGFLFQKDSYLAQRDSFVSLQRYSAPLNWLEDNISKESSVLGNDSFSRLVTTYTHHNIYHYGYASDFLMSEERIRNSYYIFLFLNHQIAKDEVEDFLSDNSNRQEVGRRFFSQYYRQKNGCYGCFPDSVLAEIILEYKNFLDKDFVTQMKKYSLDYVVWDKENNPKWLVERFFNDKVYEKDNIIIYKIP